MISYRLYKLAANHIVAAQDFEATDDGRALEQAALVAAGGEAELWAGPRKVGIIPPIRITPPPVGEGFGASLWSRRRVSSQS